jgi:CHASE2 domain-containing sensor protein
MTKLVIIEFDGDFKTEDLRVTLEVGEENAPHRIKLKGHLPANPALAEELQRHWYDYRSLEGDYRANLKKNTHNAFLDQHLSEGINVTKTQPNHPNNRYRIKPKKITHKGSLNQRIERCRKSAQQLRDRLNTWLNSPGFRSLDRRLREELSRDEEIRVLISTEDGDLQKLPWQEWEFFESYPQAEPALSPLESEPVPRLAETPLNPQVRILGILGDDQGINLQQDQDLLNSLPNTYVELMEKPEQKTIVEKLWEQPWDIIFFAGHSETQEGTGRIHINSEESLNTNTLWYGLRKAVERGLKLAIFNSCDGLGLSRDLHDYHIPQMIVMRELVPDRIAHNFLKYFLTGFAQGQPFYVAVREARQRLHDECDREFPCASWLPVICQNPAEVPLTWDDLYAKPQGKIEGSVSVSPSIDSRFEWCKIKPVLLASLVVTGLVMGVRWLGYLESWELSTYDQLMRQRQPEPLDPRLLVVEVTKKDTDRYLYPLKDTKLVELIKQLEEYNPLAIGLDIHRYQPRPELNQLHSRDDFIERFNQNKNLFTVCSYGSSDKDLAPPPEFSKEQIRNQVGFSDLPNDRPDSNPSTVRRQLLSYDLNLASFASPCTTPYSLSLHLAHQWLARNGVKPIGITENKEWQLGQAIFKQLASRTGGYQNLEAGRSQVLLNYRSPDQSGQIAKAISMTQVLEHKVDPQLIEDKIVLIGYTAPIAKDYFNTPYGKMAGVWIHTHIISQLISTAKGERSLLWVLPQWGEFQWGDALFIWFWSFIGGVLAWRIRSVLYLILASSLTILVLYQVCLVIFNQGGWMPLIPSGLSLVATSSVLVYMISPNRKKL